MEITIHLIIEKGPETGREISVPPEGIRVGRSSRNDVSIRDPALSRFHCRFFWQPGPHLTIADLESFNQTLVNNKPIKEQRLRDGDRITIGDTTIKVIFTGEESAESMAQHPRPPGAEPLINRKPHHRFSMPDPFVTVILVIILFALAWGVFLLRSRSSPSKPGNIPTLARPAVPTPPFVLTLDYEKVVSSSANIFRYHLAINGATVSAQVDDLGSTLHIRRAKTVDELALENLSLALKSSGVFHLHDEYAGDNTNSLQSSTTLSVVLGADSHRIHILNIPEPEPFAPISRLIESFGRQELSVITTLLSPEQSLAEATAVFEQARHFYNERDIRDENLALALRGCQNALWQLEPLEPKPPLYSDIVALRQEWTKELNRRYEALFQISERAVAMRDWPEAARRLRSLCALVPDRTDPRYKASKLRLIDIERQLNTTPKP